MANLESLVEELSAIGPFLDEQWEKMQRRWIAEQEERDRLLLERFNIVPM